MDGGEAKVCVDRLYDRVAERWRKWMGEAPFMQALKNGDFPRTALRLFFKNWASFTIEINSLEAASYHKYIPFFRKHRDLMGSMAQKLADELIHPESPGHIHVVLKTGKALGITEEEVFLDPMLAEFRAH